MHRHGGGCGYGCEWGWGWEWGCPPGHRTRHGAHGTDVLAPPALGQKTWKANG